MFLRAPSPLESRDLLLGAARRSWLEYCDFWLSDKSEWWYLYARPDCLCNGFLSETGRLLGLLGTLLEDGGRGDNTLLFRRSPAMVSPAEVGARWMLVQRRHD
jgi:hypothetical protein